MATPKLQPDWKSEAPNAAPLNASVRRHLGRSLQAHFAEALAAPVGERLAALLARLDPPRR
ncbi:hypothetical protein [Methylobacterium nigriterrae]|uniref:hypothetical protein n=1 Tax=Methylobacterium nigriterrae TaxID=3127512 RepID=UPI00301362ED